MAISYVVDIYRRQLEPAQPLDFAVYLSFFPHLLAGPIVRGTELLPQIRRRRDPNADRLLAGLLADPGRPVQEGRDLVLRLERDRRRPSSRRRRQHSAPEAIFAAWGYAVQIYCDFSGYTDIAIGLALLLGFRFPQNFDAPYTARNLQDFWRRWHMTLSRWLRDYLYIPLGGNAQRPGPDRPQHHDHHGAGRPLARRRLDLRDLGRAPRASGRASGTCAGPAGSDGACPPVADGPVRVWVQRFLTFQFVCLGWVFFNATGISQAFAVLGRVFTGWGEASPLVTPLLVLTIFGTLASQYVPPLRVDRLQAAFSRQRAAVQVGLLGVALLGITTFGPVGVAPFIYYRF